MDTSNAGEGALSVSIRAAGQEVRHTIQDLANGQYDVLFYPTMAIGKAKAQKCRTSSHFNYWLFLGDYARVS